MSNETNGGLIGKSAWGYTIVEEDSNPPFDTEGFMLPIVSIEATHQSMPNTVRFHFETALPLLPYILQTIALAQAAGVTVSQQQVIEAYVFRAFEIVTDHITKEEYDQANSEQGLKVPFNDELIVFPVDDLKHLKF